MGRHVILWAKRASLTRRVARIGSKFEPPRSPSPRWCSGGRIGEVQRVSVCPLWRCGAVVSIPARVCMALHVTSGGCRRLQSCRAPAPPPNREITSVRSVLNWVVRCVESALLVRGSPALARTAGLRVGYGAARMRAFCAARHARSRCTLDETIAPVDAHLSRCNTRAHTQRPRGR